VLHLLLYALLAIIVAIGLFLLASRFLPAGEQIAPPLRDEPPWELPAERGLRAEDVDQVRLPVALRGYRFAETDLLLDRLAAELRARDEEIERLHGAAPVTAAAPRTADADRDAAGADRDTAGVDREAAAAERGAADTDDTDNTDGDDDA
jgi:DivIVA domain-containing protein